MKKETFGYVLIGAGVVFWIINYYQQKTALAQGSITPEQTLNWSDRLFSPAGIAVMAGIVLVAPEVYAKTKAAIS